MKTHEERVVREKQELNVKLEKLYQFFETDAFKMLGGHDIKLLKLQMSAMEVYSRVLDMRIERFEK